MTTDELRKANRAAMNAHTNLNVFASVQAILENGCVYGPNKAAEKIIELCRKEQSRQLKLMDAATRKMT